MGTCTASKRKSIAGQGVVEYILMTALVGGTIFGVFYPVFKGRVEKIQTDIEETSMKVIGQDEMGIPEGWFFASNADWGETGARLQGMADAFKGSSNGGDNGDAPKGGGGAGGPNPGGTPGAGPDAGAGGGGGSNSGSKAGDGLAPGNASGGARGAAAGKEGEGTEAAGARKAPRRAGGGGEADDSGDDVRSGGVREEGATSEGGAVVEKNDGDDSISSFKRRRAAEAVKNGGGGGCRNMDTFMILKIVAILAILILGVVIYMVGRRGGDEN